ncbi:hypothetical protein J1614_005067 [Plenodomus biglobosus]|nr:hypothetical protein J1614_005067 [Plenodomus biglobosus]
MFANCKGPIWGRDDFSRCFQLDYLQTLFPLVACGVSVIYLLVQLYLASTASKYHHAYSALQDPRHVWSFRSPHYDGNASDSDDEDEFDRNEDLALHLANTMSTVAVVRPRGEVTVVVLEEAAVLAQLGLHVAILITNAWGSHGKLAEIVNVAVWGYVATLASLRLLLSSTGRFSFPKLWYHTAFIYGFQWVCSVLLFRSAIIHPRSDVHQKLMIGDFVLVSLLFLISLCSRKGNKAVQLEYEADIMPAREPVASVLSLATFSWVDPIVWTGYKKTYELSDVWNLAAKDKAAAVIANYRQVKKTTSLAFHLLKHFKRGLLIQAGWAAISGFLTFAPTLLLKAILEYIEKPHLTPVNAAWFYVTLLFVSGTMSALADGQALWIGRKICIRLRAVIIGEIYAKALKRRAAAGTDKILGEEKKQEKEDEPKGLKRMMTFGRKKKKATESPKENDSKPTSETQVTTGAIINLMAVDAFKVSEISAYLHFLWANTPVQVVVAIVLLYRILGYSSIAGIGMMVILLPINMYVAKQFAKIQKLILAATDARIHTTNEVLTNIRIIKFFAWEQRFIGLVNEKRHVELRHLRRRYILWAVAATIWSGSPVLITFLSFLVYTNIEHKALIPSVAFTALSLFQILRIPLDQLADMVAHVQESKVSVDRIEEYLSEPETDKYSQLITRKKDEDGQPIIGFENATFSWGGTDMKDKSSADAFKLQDLTLKFSVGKLNVIVGPTGSGKTSLLMGLLGEMTKLKGDVYLPGGGSREDLTPDPDTGLTESVAYCAQQAWLVNGTVKDNIVFASEFNQQRYDDVIEACSLKRDLEILDAGDETIVGEKGVTLSGGQKQRISLARALYSKARHVLLDDVLSAVDSHTAKWIFDYALYGQLMANRTCILVTHNVSLCLPHADFVVVLENGKVAMQGSAATVIRSGKLTEDLTKSRPASRGASKTHSRTPSGDVVCDEARDEASLSNGTTNGIVKGGVNDSTDAKKKPVSNSQEETKAEGGVKLSIITMYLKAMGPWYYWLGATIAFVAAQISSVSTNLWIRTWANAYAERGYAISDHHNHLPVTHAPTLSGMGTCMKSGTCSWNFPFMAPAQEHTFSYNSIQTIFLDSKPDVDSVYFLSVYAVLGLIFMLITFLREGFLFGGSLAASRRIHESLVEKVTHAKFRFFDQTPLGQLMNRFSKDIESVDQEVAPVAIGVVHCAASIVTIVVLISIITPAFLFAASVISVVYFLIGRFYINSSRDLKRLESVHRSPLYQQFGETLSGMTTIRAYGDERRFIRENLGKINTQHRPFIYLWAANRWLAFRVDIVGALVAFFSGAFVVLSVGKIDAGAAGLALTYAVTFTENVLWFVRLYSANEQNMNSVERVKEYLDVDQEAAYVIPNCRPPANWPSRGSVEFIGYSTRYRADFDLVLKNMTFKILPGEKVGVVGRTGAGKSSMALALFRALEAEQGKILVDDVDIGLIGLQDLRENIVMVPQDPTLFTGTIRSNLDPFSIFTDEEIYTALREVHLISSASLPASGTASPAGTTTPPARAIEIPNPTSGAVTADINSSSFAATTNPGSILANRDWERGETQEDTIIVMPNGRVADADEVQATEDAMAADNKNPFRNLSSPVSESGSNLSQGQRQLLCLARALLKAPKVLLMDEATASIDYATDAKIQETIRLIKNTTITIAHRLQTIIDYDKVLVLDKGEVKEFAHPFELVQKQGGIFRGMCESTDEFEALVKMAREAWEESGKKNA